MEENDFVTSGPNSYIETFLDGLDMAGAHKTTFFMMGYCLFYLQQLEASLKGALNIPFALHDLESEDEANRRRTLGSLMKKLRERVEIDDDLEVILGQVLEGRNFFTHHLTYHFDVTKEEDLIRIANLCQELSIQARHVTTFLNAAILKASPELRFVGIDGAEVEKLVPIVDAFLSRRSSEGG